MACPNFFFLFLSQPKSRSLLIFTFTCRPHHFSTFTAALPLFLSSSLLNLVGAYLCSKHKIHYVLYALLIPFQHSLLHYPFSFFLLSIFPNSRYSVLIPQHNFVYLGNQVRLHGWNKKKVTSLKLAKTFPLIFSLLDFYHSQLPDRRKNQKIGTDNSIFVLKYVWRLLWSLALHCTSTSFCGGEKPFSPLSIMMIMHVIHDYRIVYSNYRSTFRERKKVERSEGYDKVRRHLT